MEPSDYIGKIVKVKFKYYNNVSKKMDVKSRPFLVIRCESNIFPCDFNGFPMSSIKHANNIDAFFDMKIESNKYPLLMLSRNTSYIRVHKMQTFHNSEMDKIAISSIKDDYCELYSEIIKRFDVFCEGCF